MNADSTDTRHPHLDLQDLIAGAAGQSVAHQAREHLARCEQCQREASRWNLVAEGVRGLAADAPETAPPTPPAQAPQSRPTGRRVLAGPWRRALVVAGSAAAALVLLVGVGEATGFLHVSLNGSGSTTGTTLTAVTGCSQLMQAEGTLTQAGGGQLVVTTANGQRVTVTTTPSTFVGETGALRGDITDGASVTVGGPRSAGTVDALLVTVGNPSDDHPQLPSGDAVLKGTVTGATAVGFTVVTVGGTRVPVATSAETVVNIVNAGLGRLPVGGAVYALGQVGPGGTLAARAVAVVAQLPAGGPQIHAHLSVKDCSPASVNGAVLALADGV